MAPVLLSVVCVLVVSACSAPVREYLCRERPDQPRPEAHAQWDCQRDVIVRAAKGRAFTLEELEGAASFFELVTGIAAEVDWTLLGPVPRKNLRESLRRWDGWLEDHSAELESATKRAGFS